MKKETILLKLKEFDIQLVGSGIMDESEVEHFLDICEKHEKNTVHQSGAANVSWRRWPDEKPDYEDRYLIYYRQGGVTRTFIADYLPIEERWMNTLDAEILMWAEYNKPDETAS